MRIVPQPTVKQITDLLENNTLIIKLVHSKYFRDNILNGTTSVVGHIKSLSPKELYELYLILIDL